MSALGRMFAGDEELGKKDDDHRPMRGSMNAAPWSARTPGQGLRKRRFLYILGVVLFVYLFIQNIPTGFESATSSTDTAVGQPSRDIKLPKYIDPKGKKPPRPAIPSKSEEHYHDGPIKFFKLATSLHAAARLGGQLQNNKNVLFVASSLQSVAELIPMACEMARWERNDVHLAIMGRDELELDEIKHINGVTEECKIHWHDARPDYSRWSSEFRMKVSVTASMEHLQNFVHPQIIIIDDPAREDVFFIEALRSKVMDLGKAMIELPKNAAETMMWMTRLDSGSLSAWPTTYVDILIQAPKQSSGALVRLLRSIEDADYFGIRRPHITIELPANVDVATWQFLQNFVWPPLDWEGRPHASQVTLRHRIQRRTSSEEEASARLVESFYPSRTDDSNLLLLSPQMELSPLYYHYLIYSLLEYKSSEFNKGSAEADKLMGFSLHLPSTYPNDTLPLEPPMRLVKKEKGSKEAEDETATQGQKSPFLWQVPSSNAVLYFGHKWMEFHSFIGNRLSKPPTAFPKNFNDSHPAWLEYLLEFMRARGWYLMYPNFPTDGTALATSHSELYEVPEEYSHKRQQRRSSGSLSKQLDLKTPLTADEVAPQAPPDEERPLLTADLISLLPASGDLPEVPGLPVLSFDGHRLTFEESDQLAQTFSDIFRQQSGSCSSSAAENAHSENSANDLFCNLDDVYDYYLASLTSGGAQPSSPYPLNPEHTPIDFSNWQPEVDDTDSMSEAAVKEAKASEEMASHLNRQEGTPAAPDTKNEAATAPQNNVAVENNPPAQPELHTPIAGQNIEPNVDAAIVPAAVPAVPAAPAAPVSPPVVGPAGVADQPTIPEIGAVPQPQVNVPVPAPAPAPAQPVTTHGSFNKETPKQPVEGDIIGSGADKGTGW